MEPKTTLDLPHQAGGMPATEGQLILVRRRRLVRPHLPDGGHLVDFGCGNGAQTVLLADRAERITGVDINPGFLEEFARGAVSAGVSARVEGKLLAGDRIPLADGEADVVTSFTVLEHVPDDGAALAEMFRVLGPGGRLIVSVPNRWWIFETHGADLPLLPWNRVPLVSWWPKALHDRWARARIYRLREIAQLVTAAGFEITETFRMTAPMDVIGNPTLRRFARSTVFRTDKAALPFLATENFVVARKPEAERQDR